VADHSDQARHDSREGEAGMNPHLSESLIVKKVAELASRRMTNKVIAQMQKLSATMSGDDSGLETVWNEICVQVQYEQSFFWDNYDSMVRVTTNTFVEELSRHEQESLWLQTDNGFDWKYDKHEDNDDYPVYNEDIVDYLVREYIYSKAGFWSNKLIRDYLDR